MKWTNSQNEAIIKRDTNIIVSAGAGSGKTAVLKERVGKLVEDKVVDDIDDLLVLTFTKAAAAEMKGRIKKRIKESDDLRQNDPNRQKELLNKIDNCQITTFDAYALYIVKKYHYLLGMSKDVNIIDENIFEIKKNEYIKQVLQEYYVNKDPRLKYMISNFTNYKNDQNIIDWVNIIDKHFDKSYKKDQMLEDYEKYLDDLYSPTNFESLFKKYESYVLEKKKRISELYDQLSECIEDKKFSELKNDEVDNFLSSNSYAEVHDSVGYTPVNLGRESKNNKIYVEDSKERAQTIYDKLKKDREKLNLIAFFTEEELKKQFDESKPTAEFLFEVVKKANDKIRQYKEENDLYTYSDIARKAIEVVENSPVIRNELKYKYKEILIDEYQDTNDVQEHFISLIENNNVYVVGDIKQAIYRFRNAKPEIFSEKYKNYSNNDGGISIDLLENFRSRKEVVDTVNMIFNPIMDINIGGEDYQDHEMVNGNLNYTAVIMSEAVCEKLNTKYSEVANKQSHSLDGKIITGCDIARIFCNRINNILLNDPTYGDKYKNLLWSYENMDQKYVGAMDEITDAICQMVDKLICDCTDLFKLINKLQKLDDNGKILDKEVLDDINNACELIKEMLESVTFDKKTIVKEYDTEIFNYALKESKEDKEAREKELKESGKQVIEDEDTKKKDTYSSDEAEAFIIAKDIKDKIDTGYKVMDSKKINGEEVFFKRKVRYSDFCILVQDSKPFDRYKDIFTFKEIPINVDKRENISDGDIFMVFGSLFRLVDDAKTMLRGELTKEKIIQLKLDYMSVARSFAYRQSDDDIHQVMITNELNKTDLMKKVIEIAKKIDGKTISMILDEIIKKFTIYDKLMLIGDINENLIKINYIYQLAEQFTEIGLSYKDFIDYIDHIYDDDRKVDFETKKSSENAVKMMTIHKSKGLQFKICYYPQLMKKFNTQDQKARITCDDESGISIPIYDDKYGVMSTFNKKLFEDNENRKNISERIRLLYVALTRAEEKIILVYPRNNDVVYETKANGVIKDEQRIDWKNFAEMLNAVDGLNAKVTKTYKFYENDPIGLTKDYQKYVKDVFGKLGIDDNQIRDIKVDNLPKIESKVIDESHYSKSTNNVITVNQRNNMDRGTKLHSYLEEIDFVSPDYSIIENEKDRILIKNFIDSDIMKDVEKAKIYKEQEFIVVEDEQEKHGIIDLLLEYEDKYIIIDYKTKNIDDEKYDEQVNGYRSYVKNFSGNKPIECYLYSIMNSEFRKVEE